MTDKPLEPNAHITVEADIKIRGIGPVLSCGEGVDALKEALAHGFVSETNRVSSKGLEAYVAPKLSRRMDQPTRMAILASYLALNDAGMTVDDAFKNETGIVYGSALGAQGSTFAYLDSIIDGGDHCASSISFTNSVHSIAPSQVALNLGIRGPIRTITAFGYTAGAAMLTASNWIRNKTVKRVLLILCEDSSNVFDYSIAKMGGSCSYICGEGCTAFILERSPGGYCRIGRTEPCLTAAEALERSTACDKLFCASLGESGRFDSYNPVYGSFYNGMGVELAAAALALRHSFENQGSLKKTAAAAVIGPDRITFTELEILKPENIKE